VILDLGEVEAVRGREREDDVVFGRGGLQFEIEPGAEALAERETPGAVEAAAMGRVDDELHAADRVEKALKDERVEGRQGAERGPGGGEIFEDLARRAVIEAEGGGEPAERVAAFLVWGSPHPLAA